MVARRPATADPRRGGRAVRDAGQPRHTGPRHRRGLRLRRQRDQHHAGRCGRRLSAGRRDGAPSRLFRRSDRSGAADLCDVGDAGHRLIRSVRDRRHRLVEPAADRMPPRQGTALAQHGDYPGRRAAGGTWRNPAHPKRTRRDHSRVVGRCRHGYGTNVGAQRDSSGRSGCDRFRRRRGQHRVGHHHAVGAIWGFGGHGAAPATDGRHRRGVTGGPRTRRYQCDGVDFRPTGHCDGTGPAGPARRTGPARPRWRGGKRA
ncbi:hypothetical protein LAUMK191_03362 [Mycobacterium attenuatum]|nr:hypothetical protein LAUMK191_03362 [Mycobacterium attenuatum]